MAFDRVGLFLYPPRWERQRVLVDPCLTRYAGIPVYFVSRVRTPDSTAPVVRSDDLCRWFASRGFEVVVESQDYVNCYSRSIRSARGPQPEIEVSADGEAGEVTNLFCRFLLTRRAPARLERWEAFMHELCGTFGLRIVVADGESLGPDEFVAFVRGSPNWQRFAERFGWANPQEGGPA
jgi:hypothetical protein